MLDKERYHCYAYTKQNLSDQDFMTQAALKYKDIPAGSKVYVVGSTTNLYGCHLRVLWDGRCYYVNENDLEFDLSKVEGNYKKCIYPGTFDPITVGHIDIVSRASKLFDEVIVLIADNPSKTNKADVKFRINCAEQALREFDNVKVDSWNGLLVDYLKENGVNTIVRGIRNARDLEYEMPMAEMNRQLNDRIETVFLAAKPEYAHISSTAVREIDMLGGNINSLIPACVAENMKKRKEEA